MITSHPLALGATELRAALAGQIVLPGDETWDEARRTWNLTADQHPFLVALPQTVSDVQLLVDYARSQGLQVAMQGTGHNAMPLPALEHTLLVRTSEMRGVEIDAEARVARVEAGALWIDVTAPASEHGLAPLAGSSPDVGVVGYTLGGGLSWLGRRYGLASERVLAIEVVTADGRLVRATSDVEPDLFWALRGGGGSFAAVVAMEFELLAVPDLHAGMMLWPGERARELMHAWAVWTRSAPDSVTTSARIVQMPPLPELPDFLRGRHLFVIDGAVVGNEAHAAEVLAPLRALAPEMDTFATVPPVALSRIHMDPEEPVPGLSDHAMLSELPAGAVDALVDAGGIGSGSPLLMLELRHLGGALSRPGTGALDSLPGEYALYTLGMPMDAATTAAIEAHLPLLRAAAEPYSSGRQYSNFTERAVDPAGFYGEERLERLRAVKASVDPADVFRGNHAIAPAER